MYREEDEGIRVGGQDKKFYSKLQEIRQKSCESNGDEVVFTALNDFCLTTPLC